MSDSDLYLRHLQAMRSFAHTVSAHWVAGCLRATQEPATQRGEDDKGRAGMQALAAPLRGAQSRFVADLGSQIRAEMEATHARRQGGASVVKVASPARLSDLALVDEAQAERDIEISRVIQLIDLKAEWELRELLGFVNAVQACGSTGARLNLDHYPAAPAVFARAFSQSAWGLSLTEGQRSALMRLAGPVAADLLKNVYGQAAEQLRAWGAGEAQYTLRTSATASSARAAPQAHVDMAAPGAMATLRKQLHAMPGGPVEGDANLALLGRIFQQILTDTELTDPVREVIARLQGPVQQTAAVDPEVLLSAHHPIWTLINQIAAYSGGHSQPQEGVASDFLRFVEPLVDKLAQAPAPKREAFAGAVAELRDFIEQDEAMELERSAPAVAVLTQAEKEAALLPMLRQQVILQLRKAPQASHVLRMFLTGPWTETMARAMVTLGEDAAETQALVATVDELLGSLAPPQDERERQERLRALPALIGQLQRGMQMTALSKVEAQRVLDELMRAHRRLMQPLGEASAEAEERPDVLDRHPEIQWDDSESLGDSAPDPWQRSDTNLGQLPTVPMGLDEPTAAMAASVWVQGLRRGVRCKVFLQGQWVTARLMWRSVNAQFFMFSSTLAGGSHSMTRRALERLRAEGLATDVAEASLLQRAADSLLTDFGDSAPV